MYGRETENQRTLEHKWINEQKELNYFVSNANAFLLKNMKNSCRAQVCPF